MSPEPVLPADYVRQLEDACLEIWAHVSPDEALYLERESPALVQFIETLSDRWRAEHNDGHQEGRTDG